MDRRRGRALSDGGGNGVQQPDFDARLMQITVNVRQLSCGLHLPSLKRLGLAETNLDIRRMAMRSIEGRVCLKKGGFRIQSALAGHQNSC